MQYGERVQDSAIHASYQLDIVRELLCPLKEIVHVLAIRRFEDLVVVAFDSRAAHQVVHIVKLVQLQFEWSVPLHLVVGRVPVVEFAALLVEHLAPPLVVEHSHIATRSGDRCIAAGTRTEEGSGEQPRAGQSP